MGLPRLQTCCFVLDLKTGNIVLGALNAALSFVMMVVMIVESAEAGRLSDSWAQADIAAADLNPQVADEQAKVAGFYAMSVILAVMFAAKLAFDTLFVYGVVTERAGVIKAYFVMWVVFFLLSMFMFSVNVTRYNAGTTVTELFYIGINVYAILLSHSYYKLLNEREQL